MNIWRYLLSWQCFLRNVYMFACWILKKKRRIRGVKCSDLKERWITQNKRAQHQKSYSKTFIQYWEGLFHSLPLKCLWEVTIVVSGNSVWKCSLLLKICVIWWQVMKLVSRMMQKLYLKYDSCLMRHCNQW
jgi:hypothetical protein